MRQLIVERGRRIEGLHKSGAKLHGQAAGLNSHGNRVAAANPVQIEDALPIAQAQGSFTSSVGAWMRTTAPSNWAWRRAPVSPLRTKGPGENPLQLDAGNECSFALPAVNYSQLAQRADGLPHRHLAHAHLRAIC